MPAKLPAFLFYVNDWLSSQKVRKMDYFSRGVYLQLLCEQWAHDGCRLPKDYAHLGRLLGVSAKRLQAVCEHSSLLRVSKCGKFLYNVRLRQQWVTYQKLRKDRQEAGKASGKSRRYKKGLSLASAQEPELFGDMREPLSGSILADKQPAGGRQQAESANRMAIPPSSQEVRPRTKREHKTSKTRTKREQNANSSCSSSSSLSGKERKDEDEVRRRLATFLLQHYGDRLDIETELLKMEAKLALSDPPRPLTQSYAVHWCNTELTQRGQDAHLLDTRDWKELV